MSSTLPIGPVSIAFTQDDRVNVQIANDGSITATIGANTYQVEISRQGGPSLNKFISNDDNEMRELVHKVCELMKTRNLLGQGATTQHASATIRDNGRSVDITNGHRMETRSSASIHGIYQKVMKNPLNPFHADEMTKNLDTCLATISRTQASTGIPDCGEDDVLLPIYGDGNCGPLTILDQEYQRDQGDYDFDYNLAPDNQRFADQLKIRTECERYLIRLAKSDKAFTPSDNKLIDLIIDNLKTEFSTTPPKIIPDRRSITGIEIKRILDKSGNQSLTNAEKETILQYRAATYIDGPTWTSLDFFEVYTKVHPNKSIAVIARDHRGIPWITSFHSEKQHSPDNNTYFIFSNSERGGAGTHFESVNRLSPKGNDFTDKLISRYERHCIDTFVSHVQNLKTPISDKIEKNFLDARWELSDDAYYAIKSLLGGQTVNIDNCISAKSRLTTDAICRAMEKMKPKPSTSDSRVASSTTVSASAPSSSAPIPLERLVQGLNEKLHKDKPGEFHEILQYIKNNYSPAIFNSIKQCYLNMTTHAASDRKSILEVYFDNIDKSTCPTDRAFQYLKQKRITHQQVLKKTIS